MPISLINMGSKMYLAATVTSIYILTTASSSVNVPVSCSNTLATYLELGYEKSDVPSNPVSGNDMKICKKIEGQVCCSSEMEAILGTRSRREHDVKMHNLTHYVVNVFKTHSKRFDEFFRELLKESEKRLHDMYLATYGIMYQTNSYIFKDLFKDLEDYYTKGRINLTDAMDTFFKTLLKKMFTVYNGQYRFNERYLACAVDYTEQLKPFGDVPQKLSITVKRSFVAARTFVQTLAAGREIMKKLLSINHGSVCGVSLMNTNYCQLCHGLVSLPQCSDSCVGAVRNCVPTHSELDIEWNAYITQLLLIADRLEGPFNIESVVEPLNIKISDAIMNFQERGHEISSKVFEKCGKPRLEKRDALELTYPTHEMFKGTVSPRRAANGRNLMKDTVKKFKHLKDYWKNLPYQYCNSMVPAVNPGSTDECWDGEKKSKNGVNVPQVADEKPDPVVNGLIGQEVISLRHLTHKLRNAYNGNDVEWIEYADWLSNKDQEERGSGSGSGDEPIDDDDDEDKDRSRSGDVDYDGSGAGSIPEVETKNHRPGSKPTIFHDSNPTIFHDSNPAIHHDSDFGFSSSTVIPDVELNGPTFTSSAPPTTLLRPRMGLTKAVAILVLPVFVMWIGNLF